MKVSVIITTYKDLEALALTLDALKLQDYKDFEVVIAEDEESENSTQFLKNYPLLDIKHVSHPDIGRTKTVIQNKALDASSGEYLIFLDGDVIPYSKFISSQVAIAKRGQVLAGRRVNLDEKTSVKLRSGELKAPTIEKYYLLYALRFMSSKDARFEQGIYISPSSWIYRLFLSKRKRHASILGCNFSCFKDDLAAINGFDESYEPSTLGDDTDLTWRFKASGCELVSSKNIANIFHLWHPRTRGKIPQETIERYEKNRKENRYITKNGLIKQS
ncbi:MAG: glycosyltransferase [Campylobacterota bacterium]|nr:glycosyltransferase [Campylobacterota bacterium]